MQIEFRTVEVGELHNVTLHVSIARAPPAADFYKISASSGNPESCRIESNRRRIPRADSGRFTARITDTTTTGSASSAPMEIIVVAVVFCAGRPSFPASSRPIPQPTAVCVIARRLV